MKLNFLKYAALAVVLLYVLYVAGIGLLTMPDNNLYTPPVNEEELTDHDRAVIMADGLNYALETELNSFGGWIYNDLLLVPYLIDNVSAYQHGIIYATRPASDILAKTIARYGKTDTIDPRLADATSRYFTYSEKVWGFWFVYDCEHKYQAGIKNWKEWAESVGGSGKNAGIYNVRSDDVHQILKYCTSMTDYVLGILNEEKMGHFESDDNIYFAKGVAAVVTNVMRALITVDSSVVERGGEENVKESLTRLQYIADFDPIYVVAGGNTIGDAMIPNHVAALARHIDVANNRINDILQAMEK